MARRLPQLLATAALLAAASRAVAAPVLRHQELLQGDFTIFGNTLAHDCDTSPASPAPLVGTVGNCGNNTTDSGADVFWRSNPGAGTAAADRDVTVGNSQSSAWLDAVALPAGATVTYARLYWAAQSSSLSYGASATLTTPDGASHALSADPAASRVVDTGGFGNWYQSSADVTAVVQALADPRGRYTTSGATSIGLVNQTNNTSFDAWWMVVFYADPAETALRQVTLFDGLDYVVNSAPGNVVDVTLGGFLVPNGGFDAKLGVVTYEGDASINGDSLLFQGYRSTAPEPTVLTTLADAQNPADDFFNRTRSWLGAARSVAGDLPQYSGGEGSMQGFDLDVVDLKALGAIAAGDDSAKIRASSSGDVFALGAFVTSINTLKPSFIQTVKSAVNLTRGSGAFAGDLIEYTIDTRNTGNDPSIQTAMQDPLPVGVTYVPGSLQISAGAGSGPKTDAEGDDQAEYVTSTRTIHARLGTGATAFVGGSMAIGESAQIKFRVTVNAGASGVIQNRAVVIAAGLSGEPARSFDSNPPVGTGPTDLPVDQCLDDGHCGGATPACWTAATPNVCVGCTGDSYCGGATPTCDVAAHACVGLTTLAPAAQDRTTVAGAPAPFPLTLTSNLAGPDVYDLDVVDGGCGFGVELFTAGGALVAMRAGPGVWTIAPGGDTDADGKPDLGATAGGGGTAALELRLTPPGGSPVGASCAATVIATGSTSGLVATAGATLHVGAPATWTPDYTGAAAKVVSRGGDVGFPGVIQNNGDAPLAFSLASVVTAAPDQGALQPATIFLDPDGDGDPDGAPIASVGPVAPYGGQVRVVLVLHAVTGTGTPLATGTILTASSTATSGGVTATQAVEAKVQYAATYSDAARTLAAGRFGPCDTVYLGASLLPAGSPFALEWYAKANPVRGTDTPFRSVDPWAVSGGAGSDQLQLPANALGTWTVLVVQKTSPDATVLDDVTFQVERAGAFTAFSVPARVGMLDGLSVSASVQNQAAWAALTNTQLAYTVSSGGLFMDGAGLFSATPGLAHLTAPVTLAAGAVAADAWVAAAPEWPGPGVYSVSAEWQVQCGGVTQVIAPATTSFEVVPASPSLTSPSAGALLATPTPTFSGGALAGAAVTVTVGGTACGPVIAGAGGSWSCTLATPLADGDHSATAVQVVSGATSDPSASVAFTVDTTPPAVTIGSPGAGAVLGAAAAPGGAVAFSGTVEAGGSVVVTAGAASATATVVGTTWTATLAFSDGSVTATATATDGAGNPGTASVTFTLDVTAPAAPVVTAPADGAALSFAVAPGGVVPVSGTAEAGAVVEVTVGGTTQIASRAGTSWTTTFVLFDGAYAVSAVATDAAGNGSGAGTSDFTLDATPPSLPTFGFPLADALLGAAQAPGGVLTMTGGTDAGTTVAVTVDAAPYSAAVSGTGWSLALTLGEGLHAAFAQATDGVGNTSGPAALTFRIDLTPPAAPTLAPVPSPTSADPVAVTGSAEAGAVVELFLDGVSRGTAVAGPAFGFSLAGVAPGSHSLEAIATDPAGNASAPSAPGAFFVDRTPPGLATVDLPASGARLGAAQAPGGAVTFSGTSEIGSAVEVEVDGVLLGVAGAPGGTWAATFSLVPGPHGVRVRATDAAGNVGAWSGVTTFDLDFTGPLAPVLDPIASPTSAAIVTVTGVAEPGAIVAVWLDATFAGTVAAPTGAFSLDVAPDEGSYAVTAVATDGFGNASPASAPRPLVVDRTAPAAPVLDPLLTPTNAASVTVAGDAPDAVSVTVRRDDGVVFGPAPVAGGRFSLAVPVFEGTRSFTAVALDAAANASAESAPASVVVDWTPPPAPTLDPLASPTNATSVTVAGSAPGGTTVTVLRDGVAVGTASESGGRFTVDVPLAEGAHSFTAIATDQAGNPSPASGAVAVLVDRTPPAAPSLDPLVTPTNATSVTVTGAAVAGATVTVYRSGAPVATVVAVDGTFSAVVPVFAGAVTFTATATEAAGNVSALSAGVTVVVDHDAPVAPSLDPIATPTNATSITVSGTADAGTTVTLYQDLAPVGTAVAGGDGRFSFTVPVADPGASFVATARDSAGNVSPDSETVSVVVDWVVPSSPTLVPPASPTGASVVPVIGSAEAGSVVTVYLDGQPAATVVAGVDGSFTVGVPVTDGPHGLVATATDPAGNVSLDSLEVTVVVDQTLPAPPVLGALVSPTNATALTVGGTAEPGSTVTVSLDAAPVGVVVADGTTGAFALDVAAPEGTLAFTATSVDGVGNGSGVSNTVLVVVDRSTPAVAIASPASGALLGAAQAPAGVVTLTGIAEAGATVVVTAGAGSATATRAGSAWTATLALADGGHTATVTATDAAGNPATAQVTFTVDTAPPAVAIGSPGAGALLGAAQAPAGSVTVTGTAEAGATVVLTAGAASAPATLTGTSWTAVITLGDGSQSVTATATDAAGNAATAQVTFAVDTSPPAVAIGSPGAGALLGVAQAPSGAVTVTGIAEAGATVVVTAGASSAIATLSGPTSWTAVVTLPDGGHTVTATASDAAGNSAAAQVAITVDTAPPSVAIGSPSSGALLSAAAAPGGAVTISGTAEAGAVVAVTIGGATQVATLTGTSWTTTFALADASHLVTATATDAAGNASAPASSSFTLDTASPAAPVVGAPAPGASVAVGPVTFAGTAEPGSTVSVTVNGTTVTGVAGVDGVFSIPVGVTAGSFTADVTATDAAGNVSPAASVPFTATLPSGAHVSGGGCGCGPGGGTPASALLLLGVALALAPRRRAVGRAR